MNTLEGKWIGDLGDGTFKNPILYADYSDPDVIRKVGDDFYMTASSLYICSGTADSAFKAIWSIGKLLITLSKASRQIIISRFTAAVYGRRL